jgi:hypothetical protein
MTDAILDSLILGKKDMLWFGQNINSLKSKYNNMFIAFSNQKILDADSNLDALLKRLRKQEIDLSKLFIEFISKTEQIL